MSHYQYRDDFASAVDASVRDGYASALTLWCMRRLRWEEVAEAAAQEWGRSVDIRNPWLSQIPSEYVDLLDKITQQRLPPGGDA
jgi:hypothetical protein